MSLTAAFVGLGTMGKHLGAHIHRSGLLSQPLLLYDHTNTTATEHAETYGTKVATPAEVFGADVIFSCLPTSAEVLGAATANLPHLRRGAIWVDCTSGEPHSTREIAALLATAGAEMVDAPVSGGEAGAREGILAVMMGGSPESVERVKPLVSTFAKRVTHVGPVGAGHAVKSINNALNTSHLILATEGIACLMKLGIDPHAALEAINASSGRSLSTEVRLPTEVLSRKFAYNFKLGLMAKDVGIAVGMVDKELGDAGEMLKNAKRIIDEAVEKYGYDADYTEVARVVESKCGFELDGRSTAKK